MSHSAPESKAKVEGPALPSPRERTRQGAADDGFDRRPESSELRRLQSLADGSAPVQRLQRLNEATRGSPRTLPQPTLQAQLAGTASMQSDDARRLAPQGNASGLPAQLKAGVESLSGMRMDHVNVHYNSAQPAQLQAHAYAQGSDIHLAPGQEQHLPHEAWHVVQQAQGRVKPTVQMKPAVAGPAKNGVAQRAREYDKTLSPHKTKLLDWLLGENSTLGISQVGDSLDTDANKRSNFSWHHILAFSELAKHGEGKTQPANHGGNVRLGPNKNRLETNDVSGGTAVDYSYLPLDENEEIVLDAYSKGVFAETITAGVKSSLTGALPSATHAKTPQAENFGGDKRASAFGEWFLDTATKDEFLSKKAIDEKLPNTLPVNRNLFAKTIAERFNSLTRTYKYYALDKKVITTSGVAMTDISNGNFGSISVTTIDGRNITAGAVIDELLRDQAWMKRGSQGAIQDEATTYKFGIASHAPFVALVTTAAATIDLAAYSDRVSQNFKTKVAGEFENFRATGKESGDFDEDVENTLIDAMVVNLTNGAGSYEALWENTGGAAAVTDQYVKVDEAEVKVFWKLPVPDVAARRSAFTDSGAADVSSVWNALFVTKLAEWDRVKPLFDEACGPDDVMYIDFSLVKASIAENEKTWDIKQINKERNTPKKKGVQDLGKEAFKNAMTFENVEYAVRTELSESQEEYLSDVKVAMTLEEVVAALKTYIAPHFNVSHKRMGGVAPVLGDRRTAFGARFEGFVNSSTWNIINDTPMPENVDGTEGKKWAELGDVQTILYQQWFEEGNVAERIARAATADKMMAYLP